MSDQIGLKLTKEMSDSRKGDFAEFYAVTWLWDQGYEVFKNCGCTGSVDLVAISPNGYVKLIDVKTFQLDKRWKNPSWSSHVSRTPEQVRRGIQILGFNPATRKLRFVEHRK